MNSDILNFGLKIEIASYSSRIDDGSWYWQLMQKTNDNWCIISCGWEFSYDTASRAAGIAYNKRISEEEKLELERSIKDMKKGSKRK